MSEPVIAGNWNDDDGQVIDSLLDENTDGAKTPPPATESFSFAGEQVEPTTRIIGMEVTLASGVPNTTPSSAPQQVLPADPDRLSLSIHVNAFGTDGISAGLGSDVVRYSDDAGKLYSRMSAPGVTTSQPVDVLPHTGPVFVFAPETNNGGAGGFMTASITAVTRNVKLR